MNLQPMNNFTIVEPDRDLAETVFYKLKDEGFDGVFLEPDAALMQMYVRERADSIVIKAMISRAPVRELEGIEVPTLEKILVDLFCDEIVFSAFTGDELINIYAHALKRYSVDFSRLFNYARRRRRDKKLRAFMSSHFEYPAIELAI